MKKIIVDILGLLLIANFVTAQPCTSHQFIGEVSYSDGSHPIQASIILEELRTGRVLTCPNESYSYDCYFAEEGFFFIDTGYFLENCPKDGDEFRVSATDNEGHSADKTVLMSSGSSTLVGTLVLHPDIPASEFPNLLLPAVIALASVSAAFAVRRRT